MSKERAVKADTRKMAPCPFCGKDVAVLTDMHDLEECANFEDEDCPCEQYEPSGRCGYYTVVCNANKGGCGSSSGYFPTEQQAIQAWNKRV